MRPDPSTLQVRTFPDPVLRAKASPVEPSDLVRAVAERMIALMREHDGIGLAAPQVGLSWRLFVTHVPPGDGRDPAATPPTAEAAPTVYLNPVLSQPEGPVEPFDEGCLSLPRIHGQVLRPSQITITATDLEGRTFTRTGAGLLARCWQHENDHLDGVLILDKMLQLHRLRNRSKVRDLERDWDELHPSR